ncbi:MAG: SRPBCC family protein [Bdellovibrionota bacterium]
MSFQVKVEKFISKPATDVFRALSEGLLFMNCGADSRSMQLDFRVGGKYHFNFKRLKVSNFGEFLEIIPNKKIVFSWCQTFAVDQKPDSTVTVELFEDGPKTRLVLVHTGFINQQNTDNHKQGWSSIVPDFGEEMQNGRLRMLRKFDAPVEMLFDLCKKQEHFSALNISETVPNKKIVFSLKETKGTLTFDQKDNVSSLEIIHNGLETIKDRKAQRAVWEILTENIAEIIKK